MAISSANAAAAPTTRRVETLTSGTSWTVPTGVTFVNALLVGGGGGGGPADGSAAVGQMGGPGDSIETTVTTTPGASITYAIGAGGGSGAAGGNTTFTGATTATGGGKGAKTINSSTVGANGSISYANNGGLGAVSGNTNTAGGSGGSGFIRLEYWIQETTMKKFAVIENNKVVNIIVGVEEEVVMAHPDMFIEYTDGNWDYNNGIDGGDFFPVPVTE